MNNYILVFFVPLKYAEPVKQAVFAAGAGRYDNYDCCCWQTAGTGQFRDLPGSNPFIKTAEGISTVQEMRIEMLCSEAHLDAAVSALIDAHPYEEPAYYATVVARPS